MGTNAIAGAIGTAVGSAAAAPLSVVSTFVNLGKDLIDKFIPDPQAKIAAQQHLADQTFQLQIAAIDQQNKILAAASDNIKADPHSSGARAYFCGGVTTLILVNYGVLPIINLFFGTKLTPFEIPANILWIFATIMLGFVGVPSVMETLKSVMGMQGDSQVSIPGIKISNKS